MGRSVKLFLSILVMAGLGGCTQGSRLPEDTIVVGLGASPSTLDPRFATDAYGMRIANLVFQSFMKLDEKGNLSPEAAESWTYGNKTYTFQLKKGLKFSDGQPVTAEDILFTFQEYQSPKNPFRSAFKLIEKVSANSVRGQLVVKLRLSEEKANFLRSDLVVAKILPKHLASQESFRKLPVGSGSFELVSQSQSQILLKARKDHPVLVPKVGKVLFKIIKDDLTRYQKFLRQELDLLQGELTPGKVKALQKKKGVRVYAYPGESMTYVLVNFKDPYLKKYKFREALAQAIDRKKIIDHQLYGLATPATAIITPVSPFF